MIPAIDSYSFHRFFGHHYPGLETDPGTRMTVGSFLDTTVAMGAKGVSLESCFFDDFGDATITPLRERLDDLGLGRVWAWGHPGGLESGANAAALDDLIVHIDVAARLGAGEMRICAGGRATRPKEGWPAHKAALLPMMEKASRKAADAGVVLAIENHIDLYADELLDLVETVNSPSLGVCLDTANNLRLFEHPLEVARKLAPWVRATHIKDITAHRGDPRTFAFWSSVPLGQGAVEIDAIIAVLKQHDYRGLLALEIDFLHPSYGSEEEALRSGLAYLNTLLSADPIRPDHG